YLAAHDLRSPTQNIINFAKVLRRKMGNRLQNKEEEYFQLLINSAKRLKETTNDLLDFARINHGKLHIENFDPEEILDAVLEDLKNNIEQKDADISIGNLPKSMEGDADLLRLVFQNLISNGIKFVPPERNPQVDIDYKELEGEHLFMVKDNGIGIEADKRDQIFGLFKRLNSSAEYQGTGIGLSICKRVLEKHQGDISLVEGEDIGSKFLLRIPKHLAN
ncbi:MAG: ATP-binding protein, partial [Bacteroidota bacterium]